MGDEFGGHLPVVRAFQGANLTFPDLVDNRTGYASIGIVSYALDPAAVAAGTYDTQLTAVARAAPTTRPTLFCLDHEPEQSGRTYTAAQFVSGFRHFADVMRSIRNPWIKITPIYMQWSLRSSATWPVDSGYWPGDDYVDYFGVDAYYMAGLSGFTTAAGLFGNSLTFAQAHAKPLVVAEHSIGSGPGHGGEGWTDAQWTSLVADTINYLDGKAYALAWFETWKSDGDWRMNSWNNFGVHQGAINEWTAVASR